ncbi:translation initiation factor IF-2-like [Mustela erminea]|uniref:translation initiation factor IF-2-like n=1 Tax=Mustela erminea TaxID=36723 RepID=UPI001386CC5C|nr:translation initiation factor IF-2-like [Mustela erminea]
MLPPEPLSTGTFPALLSPGAALDGGLSAAPPPLAAPAAAAPEARAVGAHALAGGPPRERLQQTPRSSSRRALSAATRRPPRSRPAGRAQVAGPCCDLSWRSLRRSGGGGGPEVPVRRGAESDRGPLSDRWEVPGRARPPPPTRGAGAGSDRRCPSREGAPPIARVTARAGAPAPLPAGYRPRWKILRQVSEAFVILRLRERIRRTWKSNEACNC